MNHWNNKYTNWNYKKISKNGIRYSAGVLPYTFDQNGKCFFLLGKDNDNDWSDFGGRCEFKDHGDEKNTATREFYEETLGAVISIPDCLDKLNMPNLSNTELLTVLTKIREEAELNPISEYKICSKD